MQIWKWWESFMFSFHLFRPAWFQCEYFKTCKSDLKEVLSNVFPIHVHILYYFSVSWYWSKGTQNLQITNMPQSDSCIMLLYCPFIVTVYSLHHFNLLSDHMQHLHLSRSFVCPPLWGLILIGNCWRRHWGVSKSYRGEGRGWGTTRRETGR